MNWLRRVLRISGLSMWNATPLKSRPTVKTITYAPYEDKVLTTSISLQEQHARNNTMELNTANEQAPLARLLTVGLGRSASDELTQSGYEVQELELGCPFYFAPDALLQSLPPLPEFPHDYKEHEIVIVDQTREAVSRDSLGTYPGAAKGVNAWWAPNNTGRINPSLLHANGVRQAFDRILCDGGIFLVFLGQPESQEFFLGSNNGGRYGLDVVERVKCNSFEFLAALSNGANFNFRPDTGKSIELSSDLNSGSSLAKILKKYLNESIFHCVISEGYSKPKTWQPILINKFGDPVGAMMSHEKGLVLLLPDFEDKPSLLKELLRDFLPEMAPKIFPNFSKSTWTTDANYEPADITAFADQIETVRNQADAQILALEKKIASRREALSIQFDIARETGEKLVRAVEFALATLGFKELVDADEKLREAGVQRQNREDLQVLDHEVALIVEVKGITGFPSDDDALAVQKYVVMRMREWKRTQVKGLAIINHQRGLPPLSRDNEKPFRDDLVTMAAEQQIGLMTGWNLYRLVRSFSANQWQHKHVKEIFYRNGSVSIVPSHYEAIGKIERYIAKANIIGLRLTVTLKVGDWLGYELPIIFHEEQCNSLQVENKDLQEAPAEALAGIKTQLDEKDVWIGMTVYKVRR